MAQPTEPEAATPLPYESASERNPPLVMLLGMVGLKLLGVSLIVEGIAALPLIVYFVQQALANAGPFNSVQWFSYGSGTFIQLAIGVGLLAKAPTLSERIFGQSHGEGYHFPAEQLLTFMIAAVGLWSLVSSVAATVSTIISAFDSSFRGASNSFQLVSPPTLRVLLVMVVVALLQPLIGLLLVLYARPLARVGIARWTA